MPDFKIGDSVRYKDNPTQIGTITRLRPLNVMKGCIVTWQAGPVHNNGSKMAYFQDHCDKLELNA